MTLDATTGLGTTIGGDNSGIFGMSMDFDASDTLFALEQLVSGGGNFGTGGARNLVTIDTSTGLATVIGATTGGMDALAFRNDRVLSPQEFTEHLIDVIEDLVADGSLNRFPARNFLRILDQVLFRLDRWAPAMQTAEQIHRPSGTQSPQRAGPRSRWPANS